MREYIKFKEYLKNFDKDFIQQKLDEGLLINEISIIVNIPKRSLCRIIINYT